MKSSVLYLAVLALMFGGVGQARAGLTYITNFTKDDNIYTNLNEEFPHTGTGVPGSGVGTPNASYLYNPATYTSPNFIAGSDLAASNPTTFLLKSNSAGQDFMQLSTSQIQPPTPSLAVPIGVDNVTTVYTLMGAYFGQTFNVTFTGANGATETFSNVFNPDFNGGAGSSGINNSYAVNGSTTDNLFDQTALIVLNVGAGGTGNSTTGDFNYYNLTQQTYILDSQLSGQQLVSATFTTNGDTTLLLGMTVAATPSTATPEPSSLTLLGLGTVSLLGYGWRRRQQVA